MERQADFTVLMIGQRRTGKSSVLSAMLKSMERLGNETGFQFTADEDTGVLMQKKLSHLEKIFYTYDKDEKFTTLEGSRNGIDYGLMTEETLLYRFHIGLKDQKKKKKDYIIDFLDIRGEDMLSDIEEEGKGVKDYIGKCSVIMVAVDSPALMEGRWKKGYGEFHDRVNSPDNVYESMSVADMKMRSKLEEGQKLPPKLVLFVPLKCEKYYWSQQMGKLNQALKEGYKNLLAFFEGHEEYSVAITPILTLGDVVFDHYKTKELPSGKMVVEMFKEEGESSMRNTPKAPLFSFRDVERPKFSPQYCEQPLMYLLAYVLSVTGNIESMELKKKQAGIFGKAVKVLEHGILFYLFGVFYIAFLGIRSVMKDKKFMEQVRNVVTKIKLSGDGYEMLQDNLGLKKAVESEISK